jgi:multidrug resistance efflux pump
VIAVVDADSFHVDGYFEETKLARIRPGDRATVYLIGAGPALDGHVEGIASAIVDRERSGSSDLLANVNPTFAWVRLAQRIPVRIAIDRVPPGIQLIAGRTATVVIEPLPGSGTP